MNSQFIPCSLMPVADALACLGPSLHVKNPTMSTMTGRATQSAMRLMGSWTGPSMEDEGGFWAVRGFWNTKGEVKSRNANRLFFRLLTWHLHFLLLSSLLSSVSSVMLQLVPEISLCLCDEKDM